MKYFMSVNSPSRECRRVFEMGRVSAEYYYGDFLSKFSHVHRTRSLKEGAEVRSPNSSSAIIWGENISDSELFKRRLSGALDKEMLDGPL